MKRPSVAPCRSDRTIKATEIMLIRPAPRPLYPSSMFAAFAALVTWWSAMFVWAGDTRLLPGVFDIRGIVPIAYVLFALALGVAAGTLIRRTLPAMAATSGPFDAQPIASAFTGSVNGDFPPGCHSSFSQFHRSIAFVAGW